MKTAISIPDKLFNEAEREAKRRGVSRSKLYQTALEAMIGAGRGSALTGRINKTIAQHGDPSEGEEAIAWLNAAARTVMEHSEWVEKPVNKRKIRKTTTDKAKFDRKRRPQR